MMSTRVSAARWTRPERTGWIGWAGVLVVTVSLSVSAAFVDRAPGDQAITRWIQDVDLIGVQTLSDVLFAVGRWPAFVVVGVVMSLSCWYARQRLAAPFALLAMFSVGASPLLKLLIERPRPSEELVRVMRDSDSFSFPSGHVLGVVLLWGFVFYVTPQVVANPRLAFGIRTIAILILVLMGLQRVYAGAHWPSDVIGGYLWGALILAAIIQAFAVVRSRTAEPPPRQSDV